MSDPAKSYVYRTEHGGLRVVDSRVSLDSVVYGFNQGESPEQIRDDFPTLTLDSIQGAIAYYLADRGPVLEGAG